jgi:hypothetical protein
MLKTSWKKLMPFFLFALFVFLPSAAFAFETRAGNSVYVPADQTIDGNLYAAGSNITVDGHIAGDLICAGQSISVNGKVDGSVICAGSSININGSVGESVRIAGNSLIVNGKVAHNAMLFGAAISQSASSTIGWDVLVAAAAADIRGSVGRSLHGGAGSVEIAGKIGKDVKLKFDAEDSLQPHLKISGSAVIGGEVSYGDRIDAEISPNAKIKGSVVRHEPQVKDAKKLFSLAWAWTRIYALFSLLVIGLVIVSLWKKQTLEICAKMLESPGKSLGAGAIIVLISPFVLIALLISIIGIPLAFILGALWVIALVAGKILTGVFAGRVLFKKLLADKEPSLIWSMVIGVALVQFAVSLPVAGIILSAVAVFWGVGGVYLYFKKS